MSYLPFTILHVNIRIPYHSTPYCTLVISKKYFNVQHVINKFSPNFDVTFASENFACKCSSSFLEVLI